MANFIKIFYERAEFTKKKAEQMLKASNETMVALQAAVQSSRSDVSKEDVQLFIATLRQAYDTIDQMASVLLMYESQLSSRSQVQQMSIQMCSLMARVLPYTSAQGRITSASPAYMELENDGEDESDDKEMKRLSQRMQKM